MYLAIFFSLWVIPLQAQDTLDNIVLLFYFLLLFPKVHNLNAFNHLTSFYYWVPLTYFWSFKDIKIYFYFYFFLLHYRCVLGRGRNKLLINAYKRLTNHPKKLKCWLYVCKQMFHSCCIIVTLSTMSLIA